MAEQQDRDPQGATQHELPRWRPRVGFWHEIARRPDSASRQELVRQEERLRGTSGNMLRATVLGANDGVLTNLNLVMGVAGAHVASRGILITGVAGLMAGALSMALGEWVSVRSSQELNERALEIEAAQILEYPDDERRELERIYVTKGLTPHEARYLAGRLMQDKSVALDTMAREEWGIDPMDMGGSPWTAAISSFLSFALGALVPMLPFFVTTGWWAVGASLGISAVALFVAGMGATYLTAKSPAVAGLRQVVFGLVAAAITYGLGMLLDTHLAA